MNELFETYVRQVKTLPSEDHSESEISGSVTHKHKAVNRLDYSGSEGGKGSKLTVEVQFANLIDLSNVEIEEVKIIGKANIVDLSGSEIQRLDTSQLEAVHVDKSDSEIDEETAL
ncbi:hypothetical protein KJA15_02755 [Patescibacteria group bacterium]|nr:hypothetical protein [Patescibacteria group bacterium]